MKFSMARTLRKQRRIKRLKRCEMNNYGHLQYKHLLKNHLRPKMKKTLILFN